MKFILFIHGYFTPALVILTDLPTLSMGKLKTEEIQHWTRFAQVYLEKYKSCIAISQKWDREIKILVYGTQVLQKLIPMKR